LSALFAVFFVMGKQLEANVVSVGFFFPEKPSVDFFFPEKPSVYTISFFLRFYLTSACILQSFTFYFSSVSFKTLS
jgi:hypothetical protein